MSVNGIEGSNYSVQSTRTGSQVQSNDHGVVKASEKGMVKFTSAVTEKKSTASRGMKELYA